MVGRQLGRTSIKTTTVPKSLGKVFVGGIPYFPSSSLCLPKSIYKLTLSLVNSWLGQHCTISYPASLPGVHHCWSLLDNSVFSLPQDYFSGSQFAPSCPILDQMPSILLHSLARASESWNAIVTSVLQLWLMVSEVRKISGMGKFLCHPFDSVAMLGVSVWSSMFLLLFSFSFFP